MFGIAASMSLSSSARLMHEVAALGTGNDLLLRIATLALEEWPSG
jgi:hypothetical protein